jgi:hypothetical protein
MGRDKGSGKYIGNVPNKIRYKCKQRLMYEKLMRLREYASKNINRFLINDIDEIIDLLPNKYKY